MRTCPLRLRQGPSSPLLSCREVGSGWTGSCQQTRLLVPVSICPRGFRGLLGEAVPFGWVCPFTPPSVSSWAFPFLHLQPLASLSTTRDGVGPAVQHLPVLHSALPSLCCSELQGTQSFISNPLSLSLFSFNPLSTFTFSKTEGKKNCETGMLTDKPTQLSEASMSVLWMFLFTS